MSSREITTENQGSEIPARDRRALGSWLGFRALALLALLLVLTFLTAFPLDYATDTDNVENFVRDTVKRWRTTYGDGPDLQLARIDITFPESPKVFQKADGVVISPVGIDLCGAQQILEVQTYPPFLRRLTVEGITSLSWEYAGLVNRDLRFVALTLVRREQRKNPEIPAVPTYHSLPFDLRQDALATASDLEEHQLHQCADFADWVKQVAGDPPYTEQLLRIVRTIGSHIDRAKDGKTPDDICAAMRELKFTVHRAHVLAVMAARQVGIPAFGFASAPPGGEYLVGIYTDQAGWLLVDMEHYEEGYFTGGPVLLTKAPIISEFEAASHAFWYPQAGAYTKDDWYGVSTLSGTRWVGEKSPSESPLRSTEARSFLLSEMAK